MTRSSRKRKQASAVGSPPATGAAKRRHTGGLPIDIDEFGAAMLEVLNKPEVRAAYIEMMDTSIAKHVNGLNRRIESLEDEVETLRLEKEQAETEIRDLQQYTRRNAFRIHNPHWRDTGNVQEDTDKLVLELARTMGVDLAPWEIGRSHRVGKYRAGVTRPILVKFVSYQPRKRVFDERKTLRTIEGLSRVYINEDLTKYNSELAYQARVLRRDGRLVDTFTRDCKIFVRRFAGDPVVMVRNTTELENAASRGSFSGMMRRHRTGQAPPQIAPGRDATTMPPKAHVGRHRDLAARDEAADPQEVARRPGGPAVDDNADERAADPQDGERRPGGPVVDDDANETTDDIGEHPETETVSTRVTVYVREIIDRGESNLARTPDVNDIQDHRIDETDDTTSNTEMTEPSIPLIPPLSASTPMAVGEVPEDLTAEQTEYWWTR